MFISDEAFAQLHQELMLEHKAKLRMITDNNKLYRILREIKEIAEFHITQADSNIELKKCYDHNLQLCKWQEQQVKGILE